MLLRQLVTNWMRQTAGERLYKAVSDAASDSPGPPHRGQADDPAGSPEVELPPCQVAFVFASGVEAGGLVDRLSDAVTTRSPTLREHSGGLDNRQVVLVQSDEGHQATEQATRDLIAVHHPQWIVSAGFACALNQQLGRGHFLMADEVVDTHGARLPIELNVDRKSVEQSPALHLGRLLSVDDLVRTRAQRHQLADQYHALACDMETMAVARVCQEKKVPCLSVRIISEAVDDQLPRALQRLLEQKSLVAKLGAATGVLLNRPSSVKDMWKIKEDALKASDRLARFLAGVVARLPHRPPGA